MAKSSNRVAVGIGYEESRDDAPVIAVKGEHLMADEVVRIARRFNVPVVEDGELAQATNQIPIDQQIPRPLFKAVAILLNRLSRK
jgi:flagellar biosynthesis protein